MYTCVYRVRTYYLIITYYVLHAVYYMLYIYTMCLSILCPAHCVPTCTIFYVRCYYHILNSIAVYCRLGAVCLYLYMFRCLYVYITTSSHLYSGICGLLLAYGCILTGINMYMLIYKYVIAYYTYTPRSYLTDLHKEG